MAKVVRVEVKNANHVLLQLDKYEKGLRKKTLEVCKELCEIGKNTAIAEYAGYDSYDEGDFVTVEVKQDKQGFYEKGYRVEATGNPKMAQDGTVGNTVTFAEFGSGTMAGDHPMASELGVTPGWWSPHDAQQFVPFGFWEHGKTATGKTKRYTYVRPTMAMFKAGIKMRQSLLDVVDRIFSGD